MANFRKFLFACIIMLFALAGKAQSTCATAIPLSYTMNYSATSYTNSAFWFSATINPGGCQVTVTTTHGSTGKITRADWYLSDCSTLVKTDTLFSTSDSTFITTISDTVSRTYKVKLTDVGGSTNFNLKTASGAVVYIVGDLGICSGQSVTLAPVIYGAGTSPSYTWQPGGANTLSVTATPTTTTTYTLTYKDIQFGLYQTVTQTVTVNILSGDECANCQMVQNGALENTQWSHGAANNIKLPSTSCTGGNNGPISDPKYWNAPSCGTSDYFSSSFGSCSAGVPINFLSASPGVSAHSGQGYAGICSFVGNINPPSYREYIQSQLKCALVAGVKYNVSFYAALSKGGSGTWNYNNPSNNLGAFLSASSFTSTTNQNFTSYTPQVNSGIISSPGAWTKVTGTISGNGENWITIGNFYDDVNTSPYMGSLLGSYYYIDDISVLPATPTVTAGSCISGSVTITAYGVPNSTLTTWAGPSSYTATGSSITVASPTTAATYTCTVDLHSSCSSCSNITQTITIQPQTSCTGTQPTSYTITGTGTLTANPAYIANDLYINSGATYTINTNEVIIASGKKIHVKNGATLVVKSSWLHACNQCSGTMWQGIYCEIGGNVTIRDASIIEDATYAIQTQASASTTPTPTLLCQESIFNKNQYGVYLDDQSGSNFNDLTVLSCVFTCRNLGSHAPTFTTLNNLKNDLLATTPLNVSSTNPIALCNNGSRTQYGFYLNHVCTYSTTISIGTSTTTPNIFDCQDWGIYSYRTSLKVTGTSFINLLGVDPQLGTPSGVGIFAQNTSAGDNVSLIVGNSSSTVNNADKNTFRDCLRGVWTKYHRNVKINNNNFSVETTATDFRNSGSVTGEDAVINTAFATGASTVTPEAFQMTNNLIQNWQRGLWHDFVKIYGGSQSSSIATNTITSTGNNYVYNCMLFTQANNGANAGVPQDAVYITANTLTNATAQALSLSAINTSTATTGYVQASLNTEISCKYNPSATTSTYTPKQAAVYLSSCAGVKISDNSVIKCTGITGSYPSSMVQYQSGVQVNASPYSTITCNKTSNIGEAFTWVGISTGSTWKQNTMSNGRYGLVLRTTASMSNQGSAGFPNLNTWGNADITNYQTLCDATDPSLPPTSKLYTTAPTCTAATTAQPCTNLAVSGGTVYASGTTLITTSVTIAPNPCASDGGGNGGREIGGIKLDSSNVNLDSIVFPNSVYPVYNNENRWALQYFVNSMDSARNPIPGNSGAKTCAIIDAAIVAENYSLAASLNNSLIPSNTMESNWKAVNNIIINHQSTQIDSNDVSVLQSVAMQCPFTGGRIVYRSRAMLDRYFGYVTEYADNCPNNAGEGNRSSGIKPNVISNSFNLFPNPNNGTMTLEYKISSVAVLEITDINGILVGRYNLSSEKNQIEVGNEKLGAGIYLYKITGNNAILKSGKIVVIK